MGLCEAEKRSHLGARDCGKVPLQTERQDHRLEALICLSFLHICALRSGAPNAYETMLVSATRYRCSELNREKAGHLDIQRSLRPVYALHCGFGGAGRQRKFTRATEVGLPWSVIEGKGHQERLSCPPPVD